MNDTEKNELFIELLPECTSNKEEQGINAVHVEKIDVGDMVEDRYSRLRLIPWWDQDRLKKARVMVVGAGAIGNELVKNLALLGVGYIFLIDLDNIENSNLSRSILYRASDEGSAKADVAAERAMEINPDIKVRAFQGNVVYDIGLGVFRSMDVILGGLDNREARLAINQACWKVNRPWIDGAIEVLHGIARVFVPPDGSCYECTMNELDYKLLQQRKSCALLSRGEMLQGKVPTTPTTGSIIAGIQVQEAVKILHNRSNLPVLAGKGYFYNGLTHDSYIVEYPRKEFCLSHETYEEIVETGFTVASTTLRQLLQLVRDDLGQEAVLDFGREMVTSLQCSKCNTHTKIFRQIGSVTEVEARCEQCGEIRSPELTHTIEGNESYLDMTLANVGIPPLDIITGRVGIQEKHYEMSGDKKEFLQLD